MTCHWGHDGPCTAGHHLPPLPPPPHWWPLVLVGLMLVFLAWSIHVEVERGGRATAGLMAFGWGLGAFYFVKGITSYRAMMRAYRNLLEAYRRRNP